MYLKCTAMHWRECNRRILLVGETLYCFKTILHWIATLIVWFKCTWNALLYTEESVIGAFCRSVKLYMYCFKTILHWIAALRVWCKCIWNALLYTALSIISAFCWSVKLYTALNCYALRVWCKCTEESVIQVESIMLNYITEESVIGAFCWSVTKAGDREVQLVFITLY